MIEMRVVSGGRVGAVCVCDHCGKRIQALDEGLVKYHRRAHRADLGISVPYSMLHKGECDKATPPSRGPWSELDVFLMQAFANSMPGPLTDDDLRAAISRPFGSVGVFDEDMPEDPEA